MTKKNDKFIQIAAGGKKMDGEIKRMDEIKPLPISHVNLESGGKEVKIRREPSESKRYESFLREKASLLKKLSPFLNKYSSDVETDETEISDFLFREETEEDRIDFRSVLEGKGNWENVKVPHYLSREGEWTSFYRTVIDVKKIPSKEYVLKFESVDYICDVCLNGRTITRHIGFFAPFEADVTDYLNNGENVLVLIVRNTYTTSGISEAGIDNYGDKIYACTNIGTDEPLLGWHHCPAGAGIIGKITLLKSEKQRITDVFVDPDTDTGNIRVTTSVFNYSRCGKNLDIFYTLEGRNFRKTVFRNRIGKADVLQIGNNVIENTFRLSGFRTWDIDTPYLYDLTVAVKDTDGRTVDAFQTHFGMRKFEMDLESVPHKGAFYLNGRRIMLRGTNEMGHLPRAVMENNDGHLIDDIMTAKIAGLNFYRMTQRPTLKKIYDYFDMLGMLCQSDYPLFSYMTDAAMPEAYKQVDEMERLTRNHPSVIIESLCNETLDRTAWGKEQYVISRTDMEKFFGISKDIIHLLNPKRVVKYSEGDYAPLKESYGISDFHCYTYWYVSHGLPSGKLRKGYLPPIRPDYMCGCGEFGVDGLDSLSIMEKYAPKEWLPKNPDGEWNPKIIAKSQCFALHGDFFPEQKTAEQWINASREFQKFAIREYVKSLRLRSDYLESTAVHLLIDAWPMGWTKSLVDVDRIPKPAYYAFKEANIPLRVSLRTDRSVIYQSDSAVIEAYAYNDFPDDEEVEINVSVHYGKYAETYHVKGTASGVSSTYFGDVILKAPKGFAGKATVAARMISGHGATYDEETLTVKDDIVKAVARPTVHGMEYADLRKICNGGKTDGIVFVSQPYYEKHKEELERGVRDGRTLFISVSRPLCVAGHDIVFRTHTLEEEVRANNLIYINVDSPYSEGIGYTDFRNFYNYKKDYQDLTAWFKFSQDDMDEILYTLEDAAGLNHKKHKIIMGQMKLGKGKIIVSTLSCLDGGLSVNPALDRLFVNIINKNH